MWKSYRKDVPNKGFWDQGLLEHIFSDGRYVNYDDFAPGVGLGAIVVVPARSHVDYVKQINEDINKLGWCIMILTGDEEGLFPVEEIKHPKLKIYVMTPNFKKHKNVDRFLGDGWPPKARELIYKAGSEKYLDFFFAGQITHKRRKDFIKAVGQINKEIYSGLVVTTEGFTQGLDHEQYFHNMAAAKVVPCPSGPETPDTFRFYEALEAGALPIADNKTPKSNKSTDYWVKIFGDELKFPVLNEWEELPGILINMVDRFPNVNNRAYSWWQLYKRTLKHNILDDVRYLGGNGKVGDLRDILTVIIPTSPIPSHPDTNVMETTIKSIKDRLPECEILITIDGVREEMQHRYAAYQEYIRKLLWKINFEYEGVTPIMFDNFNHQSGMLKEVLKHVKTPLLMYVEHDAPLCEDIPFDNLCGAILQQHLNVIRLNHEALILDEHQYLMLDRQPQIINNEPIVRTAQWSQRPHIASTEFYRSLVDNYFPPDYHYFIEDKVHGPAIEAYENRGLAGWNDWRIGIYAPPKDMKRSYHLDGRGEDPKF